MKWFLSLLLASASVSSVMAKGAWYPTGSPVCDGCQAFVAYGEQKGIDQIANTFESFLWALFGAGAAKPKFSEEYMIDFLKKGLVDWLNVQKVGVTSTASTCAAAGLCTGRLTKASVKDFPIDPVCTGCETFFGWAGQTTIDQVIFALENVASGVCSSILMPRQNHILHTQAERTLEWECNVVADFVLTNVRDLLNQVKTDALSANDVCQGLYLCGAKKSKTQAELASLRARPSKVKTASLAAAAKKPAAKDLSDLTCAACYGIVSAGQQWGIDEVAFNIAEPFIRQTICSAAQGLPQVVDCQQLSDFVLANFVDFLNLAKNEVVDPLDVCESVGQCGFYSELRLASPKGTTILPPLPADPICASCYTAVTYLEQLGTYFSIEELYFAANNFCNLKKSQKDFPFAETCTVITDGLILVFQELANQIVHAEVPAAAICAQAGICTI